MDRRYLIWRFTWSLGVGADRWPGTVTSTYNEFAQLPSLKPYSNGIYHIQCGAKIFLPRKRLTILKAVSNITTGRCTLGLHDEDNDGCQYYEYLDPPMMHEGYDLHYELDRIRKCIRYSALLSTSLLSCIWRSSWFCYVWYFQLY